MNNIILKIFLSQWIHEIQMISNNWLKYNLLFERICFKIVKYYQVCNSNMSSDGTNGK